MTIADTSPWTPPAGYTIIDLVIECYGAGGGGGASEVKKYGYGGGGGGGGAYSKKTIASPAASYSFYIGRGGTTGTNGTTTWFGSNDSSGCVAVGGYAGQPLYAGNGGQASSCYGDTKYSGGNGYRGASNSWGGGGGEGSDSDSNGNGALGQTGGTGTDGGDGGNGGDRGIDGSSPASGYGGGGGGGGSSLTAGFDNLGGTGANGVIYLSWQYGSSSPSPSASPSASPSTGESASLSPSESPSESPSVSPSASPSASPSGAVSAGLLIDGKLINNGITFYGATVQ